MNKALVRILSLLGSLFMLFIMVSTLANLSQLADAADRLYSGSGTIVFWTLLLAFSALIASPFVLYLTLPAPLRPPRDSSESEHENYLQRLRAEFGRNPLLRGQSLNSNSDISAAITLLGSNAAQSIRNHASAVFVSTVLMQNGRLDSLIVLASQARMVLNIAQTYYVRPSPQQMLYLYSNVAASVLIAENIDSIEFSELVTPIVASAAPSMTGAVPGLQGVSSLLVNSLANGATNAFLTLRVGLITQHYCSALVRPNRIETQQRATLSAVSLVGEIVKENSQRIVKAVWGNVSSAIAETTAASVASVKTVTNNIMDTASELASNAADSIEETVQSTVKIGKEISIKATNVTKEGLNVIEDSFTNAVSKTMEFTKTAVRSSKIAK
ncbi:DUF697 domain-containing protein [Nitrosomonas sp.]|uniref:DUF697 domain-containing protein n=1 Tax=Nitrosomonas sp. TaxID=42353 RepID=UPI00261992C9|nr:DUF697 domain-containing protein [Nitrosomonas sp.]MCW5601416.1 DUF697 domain-containing protein [Nitrosomonas sp.]